MYLSKNFRSYHLQFIIYFLDEIGKKEKPQKTPFQVVFGRENTVTHSHSHTKPLSSLSPSLKSQPTVNWIEFRKKKMSKYECPMMSRGEIVAILNESQIGNISENDLSKPNFDFVSDLYTRLLFHIDCLHEYSSYLYSIPSLFSHFSLRFSKSKPKRKTLTSSFFFFFSVQRRRAWTVGVRGARSPRESGLPRRIGADYQALQSDQGCTGLHGLP